MSARVQCTRMISSSGSSRAAGAMTPEGTSPDVAVGVIGWKRCLYPAGYCDWSVDQLHTNLPNTSHRRPKQLSIDNLSVVACENFPMQLSAIDLRQFYTRKVWGGPGRNMRTAPLPIGEFPAISLISHKHLLTFGSWDVADGLYSPISCPKCGKAVIVNRAQREMWDEPTLKHHARSE